MDMMSRVTKVLSDPDRISSIDIFRSIAIIIVVAFHYGSFLPLGYVGVDLFFVISGLLIGGVLTRQLLKFGKINYFKFILQRGFKIWPSYYTFLIIENGLAIFLYQGTHDDQIIPIGDLKRYLLFYQNYTGPPFHFSFDHVWSLCIEEHFYVLLPLLYIIIQLLARKSVSSKYLLIVVGITIASGVAMKGLSYYFTKSQDTYSATHNRIDALAWGVLLSLIITLHGQELRKKKNLWVFSLLGVILGGTMLVLKAEWNNVIFDKIIFHSVLPFCFFLMILGVYYTDFSRLTPLRVTAYFSYNWYLWHPLFSIFIFDWLGNTLIGLVTYFCITFLVAVLATTIIEERALAKRDLVISRVLRS